MHRQPKEKTLFFIRASFVLLLFIVMNDLSAQLPQTDIYLFEPSNTDDKNDANCLFLSGFNVKGYNNQPSVLTDKTILVSSNCYENTKETEIVQLDLGNQTYSRLTNNDLAEYSPSFRPGTKDLTVVSVEDNKDQILKVYNESRNNARRLLTSYSMVAYYTWVNKNEVLFAYLTGEKEVMNLVLSDVTGNKSSTLVEDVGRCIRQDPQNHEIFYFVHKLTENFWYLKKMNLRTLKVTTIVQVLDGVEDFEIDNMGNAYLGKDHTLYRFNLMESKDWEEYISFELFGIKNIKRIKKYGSKWIICDSK